MADPRALQRKVCPSCGTAVEYETATPPSPPGVAMCGNCGTEVPFAGGDGGGGRVALADRSVPGQTGSGPVGDGGGEAVQCSNCGADVPLRGTTTAERTGVTQGDSADTVTCPSCGVEVDVVGADRRG